VSRSLVETYSVLNRLPGDVRLAPSDAARLLEEWFAPPLLLSLKPAGVVAHPSAQMSPSPAIPSGWI